MSLFLLFYGIEVENLDYECHLMAPSAKRNFNSHFIRFLNAKVHFEYLINE